MAVRLILAAVFGAIVGFEREQAEKLAGLWTLSLVSTGAALFTVASIFLRVSHVGPGQSGGSDSNGRRLSWRRHHPALRLQYPWPHHRR